MRARSRVVLTRAPEDNIRLRAALRNVDAELVEYPCITVEGIPVDPDVIERLRKACYSAVVFVSRNAVEHFFASVRLPAPSEVVAIGPSTAEAIGKHGWPVSAIPAAANVTAALDELDRLVRSSGPILYVRGDLGDDTLPAAFRARGKPTDVLVVYRTGGMEIAPLPPDDRPTLLTFASPSAVRHFFGRNRGLLLPTLAIGKTTAQAAQEQGLDVTISPSPDVQGMAAAIQRWVASQP